MTKKPGRQDRVILVDESDAATGVATKVAAHRGKGLLHRAFSIFVFDRRGRLLIQKRSASKYHFAGVWANTCCSHPRPGEEVADAARRRLAEEMGFSCPLRPRFAFIYKAVSPNGLVEHEYDHVLTGVFNGRPDPDPAEVGEWKWVSPSRLLAGMRRKPSDFAPWFRLAAPVVLTVLRKPVKEIARTRLNGSPRAPDRRTGRTSRRTTKT